MILDFYKLTEAPFGDTPDPRFLYMGTQHREALASLLMGTANNRGFLALIAKPGMGKTSLIYQYLEMLRDQARTAFVYQTDCDSREFLRHILLDLDIDASGKDLPGMQELLNRVMMEQMRAGKRFILVIDEAQNLEERILESVRLLSNFETPWSKVIQIVLAGQPQLAERLSSPSMLQLRQRISMIVRLQPFNFQETTAYIERRLAGGGYKGGPLFTLSAERLIFEGSEGIPRNINNLCFNAMALGCALKQKTIDHHIIKEVLADLDLTSLRENTGFVIKSPAAAAPASRPEPAIRLSSPARPESPAPLSYAAAASSKGSLMGRFLSKVPSVTAVLMLALVSPLSLNQERPLPPEAAASALTGRQVALQSAPTAPASLALSPADATAVEVPQASATARLKTISTEPHEASPTAVQSRSVQAENQ
jgi:general secretion pathway protein A